MRLSYFIGCLIFLACNNQTAPTENKVVTTALDPTPAFIEDSIPSYDALKATDSLDEVSQLQLFRMVLKPHKVKKLYDFSTVGPNELLDVYLHFDKILATHIDSPSVYMSFFNTFYNRLDAYEMKIPNADTMNVRTRLEIARIKSQIKDHLVHPALNRETIHTK
jgi:hypothetical protein